MLLSFFEVADLQDFLLQQIFEILPALIFNSSEAFLIDINLLSFPVLIQVEIIALFLLFSIFYLCVSNCRFFNLLSVLIPFI